jgi:hypothetical protein
MLSDPKPVLYREVRRRPTFPMSGGGQRAAKHDC